MTDREMLTILYGALMAIKQAPDALIDLLHEHLYPPQKEDSLPPKKEKPWGEDLGDKYGL
jgi:hypothetical protein